MATEGVKRCPFCGVIPLTYYTFKGAVNGYPVLAANIKCPVCKIIMSMDVPYKEDKDTANDDYGQTPFEYAGITAGELARKWNKRTQE